MSRLALFYYSFSFNYRKAFYMKNTLLTLALSLSLACAAFSMPVHAATGSINLSLDTARYCATSQNGNAFVGVTTGSCSVTPPGQFPPGRNVTANMAYVPGGTGTRVIDATQWANVWGHQTATDVALPFPGRPAAAPKFNDFSKTGYYAFEFTVPASASGHSGWIGFTDYNAGIQTVSTISVLGGDFAVADARCRSLGGFFTSTPKWSINVAGNGCPLVVGQKYFLNIKGTVPNPSQCPAAGGSCVLGTVNNGR